MTPRWRADGAQWIAHNTAGVILYYPLAQLVLLRAWLQTPRRVFAMGVVAGVSVHALFSLIAVIFARAS